LIATWLSANFRARVYTRASNGKLPVHIALEHGTSKHMCDVMIRLTSERFSECADDQRLLVLADQEGRTVRDYALACRYSNSIRSLLDLSHVRDYAYLNLSRCLRAMEQMWVKILSSLRGKSCKTIYAAQTGIRCCTRQRLVWVVISILGRAKCLTMSLFT